ncbi:MAG: hypothetical protein VX640_04120 [Pseudomonadota bacterium]|nr:hypothetical protein [Pseudomonadota bacterium]
MGVGLLVILSAFVGILIADVILHKIANSPTHTYDAREKGDLRHCETLPTVLDPVSGEPRPADPYDKAYRDEYRSEKDLQAQQDMALWAMHMFSATLLGVVLLFLIWQETAEVGKETKRVGEAQVRGYFTIARLDWMCRAEESLST